MTSSRGAPTFYVIAGPNGAGRTTFATEFLPGFADCRQFLNADLIAAGLSPFAPETQRLRTGRLLLERMGEFAAARETFGFETTLAGRAYAGRLRSLRREGYRVELFFLWLPDAGLAVKRVANRVRQGGHDVPEADVRRRFRTGLANLGRLYMPCCDAWWLLDASVSPPAFVARDDGDSRVVEQPGLFASIRRGQEG